jgi:Tol biopolymer transport system component
MNRAARLTSVALVAALTGGIALAQSTERVSLDSAGAQGNQDSGGNLNGVSISADGRFVAFTSFATNLVAGDTNGCKDVFVRDRQNPGTTVRVSVDSSGAQGNSYSQDPSISADGRFVAFESLATNLVAGGTNGFDQVFLHDRDTDADGIFDEPGAVATILVSVDSSGVQGNYDSTYPSISADGLFVAFTSGASNLVANDTNMVQDIFIRDVQPGTTERVSEGPSGVQGNNWSLYSSLSANGRFVALWSLASNLVASGTNGHEHIFVHDRLTGTTELASADSIGAEGNNDSYFPSISADGRWVAFTSGASNLVAGDTNSAYDTFVHDRQSGATERVSLGPNGVEGNSGSSWDAVSISGDGRFVAFESMATNLVTGDTNGSPDTFVRDRQSGTTERVSVDSVGTEGDFDSHYPSISAGGRFAAFGSFATNLVGGDTNGLYDVFVRDRGPGNPGTDLCQAGTGSVIGCPCSNPPANSPRGCDNSAGTGGAQLTSTGLASLAADSLVFSTNGEKPTATSVVLQGNNANASGIVFGQGVRCATGTLKRLYVKTASGGSITAPAAGDPSVSARSAALGDPISAGTSRWYAVYYRDPIVLGGCSATSTYNVTQTQAVAWGT